MRDSGWGGGQNTGSIVRLRPQANLPLGIAEVRVQPSGFQITFTGAVDRAKASQLSAYSLRSYRRIATPAYGGNDVDERTEHVRRVRLDDSGRIATIGLDNLRAGFVYELRVGEIGAAGQSLQPAEAHYSLNRIPAAASR